MAFQWFVSFAWDVCLDWLKLQQTEEDERENGKKLLTLPCVEWSFYFLQMNESLGK